MFDFSFGELLIVGLVALIVLGPERLPKAARFTGMWVRKARAHWYSVKAELESELASEELRRSLHDGRQAMQEAERHVHDFASDTRRGFEGVAASVRADDQDTQVPASDATPTVPHPDPAVTSEPRDV